MARTPAQRGPFGRWLTRVRTERYDRQVDALAAMKRLAGLHISQAEYSQWEAGSRVPRPDNPKVERLYEFFGSRPDEETATPLGDAAALVEAIDRLGQKLEKIETRLEQTQGAMDGWADGLTALLAQLVAEHVVPAAERERQRAETR